MPKHNAILELAVTVIGLYKFVSGRVDVVIRVEVNCIAWEFFDQFTTEKKRTMLVDLIRS